MSGRVRESMRQRRTRHRADDPSYSVLRTVVSWRPATCGRVCHIRRSLANTFHRPPAVGVPPSGGRTLWRSAARDGRRCRGHLLTQPYAAAARTEPRRSTASAMARRATCGTGDPAQPVAAGVTLKDRYAVRGFHTLTNPKLLKCFSLAVAKWVTPWCCRVKAIRASMICLKPALVSSAQAQSFLETSGS